MTVDDAYTELGLPRDASLAQAKAAWRSLVSLWHPDRNRHAGASARMQRINRALEQIRGAGNVLVAPESEADAGPETSPPRTVERRVKLTLEEAAAGCIKVLRGTVVDPCADCAGTGQASLEACAACSGQGTVRERAWFGWYGPATSCAACEGRGALRPVCQACEGCGKSEVAHYRLSVRLPPGVRDGDVLHVAPTRRSASVALDIRVQMLPHPFLVCDDDGTLRCELPVDGFRWIANRTVQMPTLQGLQPLHLQRGQVVYRLSGRGFPAGRGLAQADQIVMVVPRFPDRLSPQQERLLDRLVASTANGCVGEQPG
ncbi:MAG: DnaJ C-terminal domain-containing protein [Burkholderiaceae bacterium]